uniref:Pre-mRNA-processing factor 19 n=1 Tax=Rhabditophanes sp. KR3021 TaxID=114890 RepID=A0AC35U828_9BILA
MYLMVKMNVFHDVNSMLPQFYLPVKDHHLISRFGISEVVSECPGHGGLIRTVSFSQNGYQLASGADDGIGKLWNLRQVEVIGEVAVNEASEPIDDANFDLSCSYLVVVSRYVQVMSVKPWNNILKLDSRKSTVIEVKFNELAKQIISISMDKNILKSLLQ